MRSRSLFVVLPLLVACSSSGVDSSGGAGREGVTREKIVGGTHDASHSAVVALLMEDKAHPGTFGSCSGSVVQVTNGTGYVLTAAHCCGGDPQNANIRPSIVVAATDYGPYEQDIGNPNPAAPAYAVIPSSVQWDQAYNGTSHDFCMLQFAGAPSSMPTLKLPTSGGDGLAQGDGIEFVGYGVTSGSGQSQNSARYHVTSSVDQQLSTLVVRYSEGAGRGGPCEGDSGGPALTPAGASQTQQTVVAVTSYGDPSCSSFGVSSRVTSATGPSGFITAYLAGAPLPGPTTGGTSSCGSCQDKAVSVGGACAAAVQDCQNDASCVNLADCLNACDPNDSPCMQACASKNPKGVNAYLAINDCICNSGCSSECASECASSGATGTSGADAGSGKGKGKDAGAGTGAGSDEGADEPASDSNAANGATGGTENRAFTSDGGAGCTVAGGAGTNEGRARGATFAAFAAVAAAALRVRRKRRAR